RARTVVVGAVVDVVALGRRGHGEAVPGAVRGGELRIRNAARRRRRQPNVIEVGAHDDVLVLEHRVAALELADHVLAVVVRGVDRHRGRDRLFRAEGKTTQRLVGAGAVKYLRRAQP